MAELSDNWPLLLVAVIGQAARLWLAGDGQALISDLGCAVDISGWLNELPPIPIPWIGQMRRTWRDWIAPVYGWGANCRV